LVTGGERAKGARHGGIAHSEIGGGWGDSFHARIFAPLSVNHTEIDTLHRIISRTFIPNSGFWPGYPLFAFLLLIGVPLDNLRLLRSSLRFWSCAANLAPDPSLNEFKATVSRCKPIFNYSAA
jgi:hypothetical protein